MAVKDRRSGGRNWVPGLFAAFWILLAVFSAAYLFRIVTEPRSQTADSAAANPATSATSPESATPPPSPSSLSADQAQSLIQANEAKDKEIGALRGEVQSLSGQVAELSNRLKPLEKVLGPVAALPSSTAVTTSEPSPEPTMPIARPPKPSVTAAPPPPAVEAKPEKPVAEAPDDVRPAPKPAETSGGQDASDTPPSPVTADEPPSESTETANLTPPPALPSIPPGTTRFGIEIGSVGKQDDVRPMWKNLLTNHAALVAGLQARRVMAPDKKWRLIAGPFSSAAEAMQACGLFKKADMPCEATVFAGDAF